MRFIVDSLTKTHVSTAMSFAIAYALVAGGVCYLGSWAAGNPHNTAAVGVGILVLAVAASMRIVGRS